MPNCFRASVRQASAKRTLPKEISKTNSDLRGVDMDSRVETQIEHWSIDKLVPYARNPRKNDPAVDRM